MSVQITLEWSFSPPDYFEEPINISRLDYNMSIADGKVVAELNSAIYDANPYCAKSYMMPWLADFLEYSFLLTEPTSLQAQQWLIYTPMDEEISPLNLSHSALRHLWAR